MYLSNLLNQKLHKVRRFRELSKQMKIFKNHPLPPPKKCIGSFKQVSAFNSKLDYNVTTLFPAKFGKFVRKVLPVAHNKINFKLHC